MSVDFEVHGRRPGSTGLFKDSSFVVLFFPQNKMMWNSVRRFPVRDRVEYEDTSTMRLDDQRVRGGIEGIEREREAREEMLTVERFVN